MKARMIVVDGAKRQAFTLRLPTIVGRGGSANLKLPASTVSRHHCEFYEHEGQIVVRDLGSSNGTIINGHRVDVPTFLTQEDQVTIGPVTVQLEASLNRGFAQSDKDDDADANRAPNTLSQNETESGETESVDSSIEYLEPASGDSFLRIVESGQSGAPLQDDRPPESTDRNATDPVSLNQFLDSLAKQPPFRS